jgi:hypothetical protein
MITADDVDLAVWSAVDALAAATVDWDALAGSLEWTCWETVEHLADDLFCYAAQLGPRHPPTGGDIPFVWTPRRPGAPGNLIVADRDAGPAALLAVLETSGAMLTAIVRTRPPESRAYHGFGVSDPAGFAAMGVVETLVHTYDILGPTWTPPDDLCDRVLARLFPDAPLGGWPALLWATGRGELPDRPRRTEWRWYGAPD